MDETSSSARVTMIMRWGPDICRDVLAAATIFNARTLIIASEEAGALETARAIARLLKIPGDNISSSKELRTTGQGTIDPAAVQKFKKKNQGVSVIYVGHMTGVMQLIEAYAGPGHGQPQLRKGDAVVISAGIVMDRFYHEEPTTA